MTDMTPYRVVVFSNPGLIPLDAADVIGVSVKAPGSFGFFGTGIKYGISSVLRNGGEILIVRGEQFHRFTTEAFDVKGVEFQRVVRDGIPLGFTTQLGKTWEPWMVFREFRCNALDEGGIVGAFEAVGSLEAAARGVKSWFAGPGPYTHVLVKWDAMVDVFDHLDENFIRGGGSTYVMSRASVSDGESKHIFYQGVRVYSPNKPTVVKWNFHQSMDLTEDRTLKYPFMAEHYAEADILRCNNEEILSKVLTADKKHWEFGFDYARHETDPSEEFVRVAANLSSNITPGALKVLSKWTRMKAVETYKATENKIDPRLVEAVDITESILGRSLGFKVFEVPSLEDGSDTMQEKDCLYVVPSVMSMDPRSLTAILIRAQVSLDDDPLRMLIDLMISKSGINFDEARYDPDDLE